MNLKIDPGLSLLITKPQMEMQWLSSN